MKKLTFIAGLIICTVLFSNFIIQEHEGVFEFETEVIDYGTIIQNSDGVRYFTFKNVGINPISISKIKPSCGCTGITKPEEPVEYGKTGRISVKFDTKRLGKFFKSITVYSDATEKTKVLRIKGEIIKANTIHQKPKSIVTK
jgi:hypothetical protein